jgi:hypothetical protein
MRKQLDALGNSAAGSVDLTYWKTHEREVVGIFRRDQRHAVLEFYQTLEQYRGSKSAINDTRIRVKARTNTVPDQAEVKVALEKRLRQVGLERVISDKL